MKSTKSPKSLTKQEIIVKLKETFSGKPTPKEIKKIRTLAMSKNIKLKEYRKLYCKKCLTLFDSKNSTIRIKSDHKIIRCKGCGFVNKHSLR